MKIFIIFGLTFLLCFLFRWLSKGNNGGSFGQKVRASNWESWQMAVRDKEQELQQLKDVEPKL